MGPLVLELLKIRHEFRLIQSHIRNRHSSPHYILAGKHCMTFDIGIITSGLRNLELRFDIRFLFLFSVHAFLSAIHVLFLVVFVPGRFGVDLCRALSLILAILLLSSGCFPTTLLNFRMGCALLTLFIANSARWLRIFIVL